MSFNTLKIAVGAGEVLTSYRGAARKTVTPKAATTPTVNGFIVTTAELAASTLRKGDMLVLSSATPTNLALEASTQARVTSIVASGADWQVNVSPALGSAPAAGSASVTILYHDRGATDGDIVLEIETTLTEQEIDQSMDIVAAIRTARKITAMIPLAEATLENLALSAGLTPPSSGTALDIGDTAPGAAREDRFLLILPGPDSLRRFVNFHRGVVQGKASHKASKKDKSVYACEARAMPDSTMTPTTTSIVDAA